MSPTWHPRLALLALWLLAVGLVFVPARWPTQRRPQACRYPLGIVTARGSWVECLPQERLTPKQLWERLGSYELDERCLTTHGHRTIASGQEIRIGRRCTLSIGRLAFGTRFVLGLPVDINRATAAELQLLPRVGPVLARRIAAERGRLGCFVSWRQVRAVRGVGPASIARLRKLVQIDGARCEPWTGTDQ